MSDDASLRARLEARLEQLTRRIGKVEGDLRRPRNRDWEEQALEAENDEVLEELDAGGLAELAAVRAALERMQDGTYGVCARCGEAIGRGRLEAIPHAATCVDCAA